MRHEAYQYEFPLRQGEFGFFHTPAVLGLCDVLGAFAWWAVLVLESVDLSPTPAFNGMEGLPFTSAFRIAAFELEELLCHHGVELGYPSGSDEDFESWLAGVAEAYEVPVFETWCTMDVRRLMVKVRCWHAD